KSIWNGGLVTDIALAAAPSRFFTAWTDIASLHSMILSGDAAPLTNDRIIATARLIDDVEAAWDGAAFVAAWTVPLATDHARLQSEHLNANGGPVEAAPAELASGYAPALASTP